MEKSKKILVIDDEPELCELIKLILEDSGFTVEVLQDPNKAIRTIKEGEKPDLILLDVVMPEITGWEVCEKIKKDKEICNIPVMFLTVNADSKYVEKGFALGAKSYMCKPFQPVELLKRIMKILTA